jgi:hypothetical protein
MFSSHCGLGLSIFTRRWEHRRFEDDFVARVVTLYAEELYKVLDTRRYDLQTTDRRRHPHGQPLRGQNVVKDGIHIIFKNVHLTATIQQLIRQRVDQVRTYPDVAPTGPTQQCGRRTGRACDYQQLANGGSRKPGGSVPSDTRHQLKLVGGNAEIVYDERVKLPHPNGVNTSRNSLRRLNTRLVFPRDRGSRTGRRAQGLPEA